MSDGSLRLGAIGCGQVFERLHLPAIDRSRDVRLTSVCETDAGRWTWLRQVLPDVTAFAEAETLLAESALDAVLVCTPPQTHAAIVLAALEQGLHVLAEKPLATDAKDGRAIVEAARDSDRRVVVGFNRRFRRTYQTLRSRLAEGKLELDGLRFVFQADADRWNRSPAAGERHAGAIEPSPAGILSDVASHQLDLVPWLTGRIIEEVRARSGSDQIGRNAVTIRVRMKGGVESELHAGYGSGYSERLEVERADRRLVAYPAALIDPKRIGATLFGARRVPGGLERGMARATEAGSLLIRRSTGRPSLTVESVERQLACFASRVRGAGAPESALTAAGSTRWLADGADERDGMWCAAAVDACRRSLDTDGDWEPVER